MNCKMNQHNLWARIGNYVWTYLEIIKDSGSNLPPGGNVTPKASLQGLELDRTKHGNIPPLLLLDWRGFLYCTLLDLDEPASYKDTLTSPKSTNCLLL